MPLIVAFLLVMLLVIRQYMLSLEFCDVDLGVQVLDFLWIFWDVQDSISAAEMILVSHGRVVPLYNVTLSLTIWKS